MKNLRNIIILALFLIIALVLWKVTREKVDPKWKVLKTLQAKNLKSLDNSRDDIQQLFEDFQTKKYLSPDTAYQLISTPFLPTMEFVKFEKYVKALEVEKRIIISSVTGAGSSTLIDRLAKFIAINSQNILSIKCAPQFDLIYHKKYIGQEVDGVFREGELLRFWRKCEENPEQKFIAIFDDFDKINPETLFGPFLWEKLSDDKHQVVINGKEVIIPKNFYMISSTLSGIGSRIKLHNEHFKRLGKRYFLAPSTKELSLFLASRYRKMLKKEAKGELFDDESAEFEVLKNEEAIFQFLYLFEKSNEFIRTNFSPSFQLGQWNNLRKMYHPNKKEELFGVFIDHVNAISPEKKIKRSDFNSIEFSINNEGLLSGSSPLITGFKVFKDWGFLTEFVVAICFALITALISIYLNSKRKRKITKFLAKSEIIYSDFDSKEISADDAISGLNVLKNEIEEYTKTNKISFPEAIFFYNSIREKVNAIEITININSTFLMLMDIFLEDDILTKTEFGKLQSFLEKIRPNISKNDYIIMKAKVELTWQQYGENEN